MATRCRQDISPLLLYTRSSKQRGNGELSLKILIVEAQEILRVGLRSILAADDRVTKVYEASNAREMRQRISGYVFDLIIINQDLLIDTGVLRTKQFIVIANEFHLAKLKMAYTLGASGYLSANVSSELLCSVLGKEQTFLIEPSLVPMVMEFVFNRNVSPLLDETLLTPRENEIVCLLREGVDRASIARRLCIAEATLKTHLKNIAKKHHDAVPSSGSRRQRIDVLVGRTAQVRDNERQGA